MNRTLSKKISATDRKAVIICLMFVLAFVALTMIQDMVRSNLKNSAFYFSESFMFSSFWWLFAPLFFTQYFFVKHRNRPGSLFRSAIIILPIVLHLIAFPLLVWSLSKTFYYHTYSIQQTFRYGISEYLYLLIVLYSVPVLAFQYLANKTKAPEIISELQSENSISQFINTILVSEGYKKYSIAVSEIYYCSSNSPYINIHLENQKYLHNETLKSISLKLNPEAFVRIHKSAIVNINMVVCCKTRLNGDYDVTLKNAVQLRVSRNFAPDFKKLFNKTHQLASK